MVGFPFSGNFKLILTSSGLHLSAEGYKLLYREVTDAIRQHFPDQTPEKSPIIFSEWNDAPRYDD
jgi:hypothetical protein